MAVFIPYKRFFFLSLSLLFLTPAIALFSISCIHHQNHHAYHSSQQEVEKSPLNKVIRDLSFFPINNYRFRLSELKDIKAIVFVMREKDCPISEKYGVRLTQLEEKYSKQGIKFIYVYVGQVDIQESAKSDLEKFGFKGAYVVDSKQRIINTLFAKTTGDVFVLTPERKVIYRGPVDDQYHILQQVPKAKNHYLFDVLQNVVSGKKVIPKELSAPGCFISRPLVKEKVFYKDVAPIIYNKCTSCHNPEGTGLMNFTSYEDIVGRGAMFKYVIENDLMPPWYVDPNTGPWKDDLSLTVKEKAMLLKWVNSGFSRKDKGKDVLETAWREEKLKRKSKVSADYVIRLSEKVIVPVSGFKDYKRFIIQTNFKEDKWIKDIEFFLHPKLVHHLVIFVVDSSYKNISSTPEYNKILNYIVSQEQDLSFASSLKNYANFTKYDVQKMYKNSGIRLPSNSNLIIEIHYEPIGREAIDDYTQVHINFYKNQPKYELITHAYDDRRINIPPYHSNYKMKMSHKTKKKGILVRLYPHMHLRGKASSIYLIDPKGKRKKIFSMDPYIRNFDRFYTFKKPLIISKGSTIECINWFDNSVENIFNPDPSKYVINSLFTKEGEMSICFLKWLVPVNNKNSKQFFYLKFE